MSVKKQRSAPKVVKNLLLLREELTRRKFDYVAKQVVDKIDTCLYGEFKLKRNDDEQ